VIEHRVYAAEGVALTVLLGGAAIWLVMRALGRTRPNLDIRRQLWIAFALRVFAAAALSLTTFAATARGGDEPGFIFEAHLLARTPFSSHYWLHALTGHYAVGQLFNETGTLHIFLMALQVRFFGASVLAMRTTMAAISVIGIALIAGAAYELAGARAAKLTAWVIALEPANIFFSTALHKEPTLYLAVGMIAFGGALLWRRARFGPVVLMILGCLVATASRPYAGWFLAAGCALILLHAAVRAASSSTGWAVTIATIVVGVAALSTPAVAQKTTQSGLTEIQSSQAANAADTKSHLALGAVDFSTRGKVIVNLPRRMFDLMFRPYPWQVANASEQLGVIESLFVLALIALLARAIFYRTRALLGTVGPLLYPAFTLLVAYSLAVGNAGTGFRYRTQLVLLMVPIVLVLRAHARTPQRSTVMRAPVAPAFARPAS
jgi:hypothetical protein